MGLDTGFKRNEEALAAERAADAKDQDARAARQAGDQVSVYRLKQGKTLLRVLGAYSEKGLWFRMIKQHYIGAPFTCPRPFGSRCPICEEGERLHNEGTEESIKQSSNFRPRKQYLFNVVVLSDPKGVDAKKGVHVLLAPETVKQDLLYYDVAVAEGYGDMTDVYNGFNITIERTGQGKTDTRYRATPFPQRTDIQQTLRDQGIDPNSLTLYDLDAIFAPQSYESLKASLEGRANAPGFPPVAADSATAAPPAGPPNVPVPEGQQPAPLPQPGTVGLPNAGVPAGTATTTIMTPVAQPAIPDLPTPPGDTTQEGNQ